MDWRDKLNALKAELPSTEDKGADEMADEGTNDSLTGSKVSSDRVSGSTTGTKSGAGVASSGTKSGSGIKPGISEALKAKQKEPLRVELDKRKGKPSTLITEFLGTDDELKELAKLLKVKCSAGGSSRDGEILIQGDFRKKIAELLGELGYKVKRINFNG